MNVCTKIQNGTQKWSIFTLRYEILLSKLQHYGIDGNALNWFKNYLIKKTQMRKY